MPADPRRVKDLFGAALDLSDIVARQALLDRECGDDADLRRRLDALLAAYDCPDSVLAGPLAAAPDSYTTRGTPPGALPDGPPEGVGSVIAGRYKLLEPIGEGGMG